MFYKISIQKKSSIRFIRAIVLVWMLFGFFKNEISAQDIHYSQFNLAPLNLNAAYTGLMDADYRVALQNRQQWKSVTVPYKTFSVAFDMKAFNFNNYKQQISFGVLLNNDVAGDGGLNSLSGSLNTSAHTFLGSDSIWQVGAGVQIGVVSRSINFNKLYFDEQFDGDVFNPSLSNSESFANDNKTMFDAGAGISIRRFSENFNLTFGFGMQHINQPQISWYDNAVVKLPMHITASLFTDIKLADEFNLMPSVLFMKQNSLQEFTLGSGMGVNTEGAIKGIDFGIWWRTGDAVIVAIGADFMNFHAGVSYDINYSGLRRASNNKGAIEVALTYSVFKVKDIKPSIPCIVY